MKLLVLCTFLLSAMPGGLATERQVAEDSAGQEIEWLVNGGAKLSWPSEIGKAYSVEVSFDLRKWEEAAVVRAYDAVASWCDAEVQYRQKFYRIKQKESTPDSVVWRVPASFTGKLHGIDQTIRGGKVWIQEDLPPCCFSVCPSLQWSAKFYDIFDIRGSDPLGFRRDGQNDIQPWWDELTGTIIPELGLMRTDALSEMYDLWPIAAVRLSGLVTSLTEYGFTAEGTIGALDFELNEWILLGRFEITGWF